MVSLWGYVTHVISRTRPSRFSACNIEKLGVAWLARLSLSPVLHTCTLIKLEMEGAITPAPMNIMKTTGNVTISTIELTHKS